MEKGYRAWGADITLNDTPFEAGLSWAVKPKRDVPFLGRGALARQQRSPLRKRMACFTVSPDVVLLGRETIYRDGERVGWLTSGGYGYTVQRSIGYGYVSREAGVDLAYLRAGTWDLEVATRRVPATFHEKALYDRRWPA